jgi:putative membrane protein
MNTSMQFVLQAAAWDFGQLGWEVTQTALFGTLGIVLFVVALKVIRATMPYSVDKEIAEDQNVALGIVMGAILLGLAIIVAVAIKG